jgi:ketosteroid isomerase-like protein
MKTVRTTMSLLAGCSLLLAGCAAPPEAPTVNLAAEKAAIGKTIADQLSANNQPGEAGAEGYVSVASEDLVLLPPNGERLDGRQAVRDWALQFTSSPEFSVTYEANRVEVATSGDLAYAIGTYELSFKDADGNTVADKGKFMDGFRRGADGSWKMTVIAYNSDLPAAGTPAATE